MALTRNMARAALAMGTLLITPSGFGSVMMRIAAPPPSPVVAPDPVGVAPAPGYVWANGHWDWVGGNWVWIGGRWASPPHGRRVWVEPYHGAQGDHFRYHRGHWR